MAWINVWAKTRPVNNPYTTFQYGDWEWRVLKAYQSPEKELGNQYARWLTAVRSPYTFGTFELGDTYIHDIPGARRGYRGD